MKVHLRVLQISCENYACVCLFFMGWVLVIVRLNSLIY